MSCARDTVQTATRLVLRNDDGIESRLIAFDFLMVIVIMFGALMLVIPLVVFFSPAFAYRWRPRPEPDIEQNHQSRQPRTLAVHHTSDEDDFVHIDIIDDPPQEEIPPHSLHGQDQQQQQQQPNQPNMNTGTNSSFKVRISDLIDTACQAIPTRSAAMYQSFRHSLATAAKKMSKRSTSHNNNVPIRTLSRRARRRERIRGLSIDLPVMQQPAWQRLASGAALSPATTLGEFIRQAHNEASLGVTTPATQATWSEDAVQAGTPIAQNSVEPMIVFELEEQEKEEVGKGNDAQKKAIVSAEMAQQHDEAPREAHRAGFESLGQYRGHDRINQCQDQGQNHDLVLVQRPDPVYTVQMGIAH